MKKIQLIVSEKQIMCCCSHYYHTSVTVSGKFALCLLSQMVMFELNNIAYFYREVIFIFSDFQFIQMDNLFDKHETHVHRHMGRCGVWVNS